MKRILYFGICLFFIVTAVFLFKGFLIIKLKAATSSPQLLINEIMYNPAGTDGGHEWLEIYNYSTSTSYAINGSWRFNDGSNHQLSIIAGDEVIEPAEYWVLSADDQIFLQDYPDYQGTLIDTVMSLNNSADTLSLSVDSGQSFFATTTYQSLWGGGDNGYSLERINLSDFWQESFMAGGTPGLMNSTAPTNTPPQVLILGNATGTVGELMIFSASATDAENDALTFFWDIAGLATSSLPLIEWQFNATGTYEIYLEISDGQFNVSATLPVFISQAVIEPPAEEIAYSDQLVINEILPNPSGSDTNDEWIELYNRSAGEVDLAGWQLADAAVNPYQINHQDYLSTVIGPYGYFVVYRSESGLALNNDGDQLSLFQPDGNLLDQAEYADTAQDNYSYAKDGGSWSWTFTPTPGAANVIQSAQASVNQPATIIINQTTGQNNQSLSSGSHVVIDFNPAAYLGLRINEFLPNPTGSDSGEWIELYNNSSTTLNLFGFSLDDAAGGSRPYVLPASATIPSFGYLTVDKADSKISLNNDQDEVRLIDPLQEIIQTIDYVKSSEGESYNYNELEDEWFWSKNISLNASNVLPDRLTIVGVFEEPLAADVEKIYFPAEVANLGKGDKIKLKGTITAVLNSVNARAVYVAALDEYQKVSLEDGLQVYSTNTSLLKDLQAGDVVEFSGYVSESGGFKRLNLNKESIVSIIGKVNLPEPVIISTIDVNEDFLNGLISIQGQMTEKKSNYFYLDDGDGEVKVVLRSFKISSDEIAEGDYLEVAGILTQSNGEFRLIPRSKNDLIISKVLGAEETATSSEQIVNFPIEDRKSQVVKYLSMVGGTILTVGLSLLAKLKFFHH